MCQTYNLPSRPASWTDEGAPIPTQPFTYSQLLWFPTLAAITMVSIDALRVGNTSASLFWIIYESYIVFDHSPFCFTIKLYKSPRFNYEVLCFKILTPAVDQYMFSNMLISDSSFLPRTPLPTLPEFILHLLLGNGNKCQYCCNAIRCRSAHDSSVQRSPTRFLHFRELRPTSCYI